MIRKTVEVVQLVEVEIDETKFDDEFMKEFRESFYQFGDIDDHIKHIAQMYARGLFNGFGDFVEGYGVLKDMGVNIKMVDQWEDVND